MELASIRISRLNRLMHYFLSYGRGTSRELLSGLGYSSLRMLQRDISYLRNEYNVDITYDFSMRLYICRDSGHFILYFSIDREEAVLLAVSLSIASGILQPGNSACSETLWNKLRAIVPGDIAKMGGRRLPDVSLLLPEKYYKKYRRLMDIIDREFS